MAEYQWRQPVGGKTLVWGPLTVGAEIDIQMSHARAELAPMRPFEQLRRRISQYDGKPVCTLDDLKGWDTLDIEAFSDEVEKVEAERRATVIRASAQAQPGAVVELEAALMELRAAAAGFSLAADRALAAVKAVPPLERGK